MIDADDLRAGSFYFFLTYDDHELKVPIIETLRFVSVANSQGTDSVLYLFDRVSGTEPAQCRLPRDLFEALFDFDALVEELEENRNAQRQRIPFEPRRRRL